MMINLHTKIIENKKRIVDRKDTKISFTDFKEFIDTTTFEAENIILPPENGMLGKWADDNAQAWKMIQEMLDTGELKYTPQK